MRHPILVINALLSLWVSACADPKCPPDYILTQGRCKRCPEGSEARNDICVNEGGVIASPAWPDDNDDSGSSGNAPSAETGTQPNGAIDSGWGAVPPAPTPPAQPGDSGSGMGTVDASISVDSGAAPIIDPCHGMAGCVACTGASQCPDPGACLVKQCNMDKGICEPSFAAAQTACGTSKCDGAGKCVGCLSDSDCGEPGECKVRYCNPTTRVCEPRNAPTTTACPKGHCELGVCVQCSGAGDCADRTCQTKSCVAGECRYANVPTGQRGGCASGVCTATQQCRECATDAQCTGQDGICTVGRCMNNACRAEPKRGACGPLRVCSGTACVSSCNNNAVDTEAEEECDATAAPWNSWTCNTVTCKRTGLGTTSFRRRCTTAAQNCGTGEMCVQTPLIGPAGETGPVCFPACVANSCPTVPGWNLVGAVQNQPTICLANAPCMIRCDPMASSGCPPGVRCDPTGICAGPFN